MLSFRASKPRVKGGPGPQAPPRIRACNINTTCKQKPRPTFELHNDDQLKTLLTVSVSQIR